MRMNDVFGDDAAVARASVGENGTPLGGRTPPTSTAIPVT